MQILACFEFVNLLISSNLPFKAGWASGAYTGGGGSPLVPPGVYGQRLKSGVVGKT